MDYFSHGLWSYIFFHRSKKPIYAVLFGLVPDSGSWMIYFLYNLFTKGLTFGKPHLSNVPDWVFTLYGISHSLIISGFFSLLVIWLVYHYRKTFFWYILAWPITVVMDTLTHTRDFLPTPFLWPISSWPFPGISWGTKWFFISNWGLIFLSLIYIVCWKKGFFIKGDKDQETLVTKIIFWLHLPIVLVLFGLFFVPKAIWPGKVVFHFWYFVGIILVQFVWSVGVFRKFDIICPLTTLLQWLRGYPLKSKKNYGHSFIAELLERLKIRVSYRWVNGLLLVSLVVVVVQYVWFS